MRYTTHLRCTPYCVRKICTAERHSSTISTRYIHTATRIQPHEYVICIGLNSGGIGNRACALVFSTVTATICGCFASPNSIYTYFLSSLFFYLLSYFLFSSLSFSPALVSTLYFSTLSLITLLNTRLRYRVIFHDDTLFRLAFLPAPARLDD